MAATTYADELPRLLAGRRRRQFAVLLSTGLGQAGIAVVTALTMPVLLAPATTGRDRIAMAGVLVLGALALGLMRVLERSFAERLGQDYVQQMRLGLVASSLESARGPSIGITVARTTNDLSAIRNWVALGVAPIVVGVPVMAGTTLALGLLHPALAVAVVAPMLALVAGLAALSRPAFHRARQLRRRRGQLSAHVADTVTAAAAIRTAGGVRRELRHVDRLGNRVAAAAVRRATVAGWMRGAAVAVATLAMVAVAAAGSWWRIDAATVATALTVVGVLAGPVNDLGRVAEYRQSYQAARRILAPAISHARTAAGLEDRRRAESGAGPVRAAEVVDGPARTVHVSHLTFGHEDAPGLVATPGSRVVLRSADPERVRAVLDLLSGNPTEARGWVRVAGHALVELPSTGRRLLVGHAARGLALERGPLSRALRYRDPDSDRPVAPALQLVGLEQRVASLPERERTRLRRGGEPLSIPERARLQVARAVYGEPPLLVLDHIDDQLGVEGRRMLRELLESYPGVAVIATDDADALVPRHQVWDLDGAGAADGHVRPVLADGLRPRRQMAASRPSQ